MKTLVLVDTNMFLLAIRDTFQIEKRILDVIPGAEIRVPSSVIRELGRLEVRGVPNARAASKLATRFAVLETDLEGDAAMETLGRELKGWVVTLDGELKERLEKSGVGVLYPRGRGGLAPSRPPP